MGKKGVEEMIEDIEEFVNSCKFQPLSNNKITVPKDELERMLNELKLKLPSEIERCKKIMRNKEAILASARTRSDAIISESVNEANRLVDQNHITELANARANEILESARAEATQILADANAEATDVRLSAMLYTKQKIGDLKTFLEQTLEAENENYRNLVDSLENNVFTLDTNLNEVEASLSLINSGVTPQDDYQDFDPSIGYQEPVQIPQQPQQPAGPTGILGKFAASSVDEDDYDDDDYDDDFDDDDDDFLDE